MPANTLATIGSVQAAVPLLSTKPGTGVPGCLAPCSDRGPGRPPRDGGPTAAEGPHRENVLHGKMPASEPPAAPPPPSDILSNVISSPSKLTFSRTNRSP